jgi:hypothetical protein
MNLDELFIKVALVLNEYEDGERGPERSMELISSFFNRLDGAVCLPQPVGQIRRAVDSWEDGDRRDVDVLATIYALTRA